MDKLIDMTEDKILGFDVTGTTQILKLCLCCSLFKWSSWVIILMKIAEDYSNTLTCPFQHIIQFRRRDALTENITVGRVQVMLPVNSLLPLIQV